MKPNTKLVMLARHPLALILVVGCIWAAIYGGLNDSLLGKGCKDGSQEVVISNKGVCDGNRAVIAAKFDPELMHLVTITQSGLTFPFYVHKHSEVVSDQVRASKRVYCPDQIVQQMETGRQQGKILKFVDVGSNIGSCAVLAGMLGHTAFAFEPVPTNYRIIAQNMVANQLQDKVHLSPCAAGNMSASSVLYSLEENRGHSMVGSKQLLPEFKYVNETIHIMRGDAAIGTKGVDILKMDVEGYEFYALQGLSTLLSENSRKPRYIFMEYSPHLLQLQGVVPAYKLLWLLHNFGYDVFYDNGTPIEASQFHTVDRSDRSQFDIMARPRAISD